MSVINTGMEKAWEYIHANKPAIVQYNVIARKAGCHWRDVQDVVSSARPNSKQPNGPAKAKGVQFELVSWGKDGSSRYKATYPEPVAAPTPPAAVEPATPSMRAASLALATMSAECMAMRAEIEALRAESNSTFKAVLHIARELGVDL